MLSLHRGGPHGGVKYRCRAEVYTLPVRDRGRRFLLRRRCGGPSFGKISGQVRPDIVAESHRTE